MIDTFLHNIIRLRERHGLSKKEMAERLEISIWMLNKMEKGELPPNLKTDVLFCISKKFGISMANMLSVPLECDSEKTVF